MGNKTARQQYINEMVKRGEQPNARQLAQTFHVHENTIRNDLRALNVRSQLAEKQVVAEMIGRTGNRYGLTSLWNQLGSVTVDWTKADYIFFDKLRRGKAPGYELGGLFADPIARILLSWVFGSGVKYHSDSNEALEDELHRFVKVNALTILQAIYDSYTLGDGYLAVNPDGTLTQISPNQVEKMVDDLDYRRVTGFKVMTKTDKVQITDEYTLQQRTITIRMTGQAAQTASYPNLIGRLPIIHFACDAAANEIYGHPKIEKLLKLFAEYDDVLRKSLDGVKVMGHPIPVLEGMEDPAETLGVNANDTETWTDASGQTQSRPVVDFTRLSMMIVGKGGSFKFASPGAFTQDAGRLLEYLFLLMLQSSGVPEWVWGGAVASSKASVDAQMPAFSRLIELLRLQIEGTLLELVRVWASIMALSDPLYTLPAEDDLEIEWPELSARDETLTQNWAKMALENSALTRESLLKVADLPGVSADEEIIKVDEETQGQQDGFNARVNTELNTPENVTDMPTQLDNAA